MKKSINPFQKSRVRLVMAIIAFLILLATGTYLLFEIKNQNNVKDVQITIRLNRDAYELRRLEFCFNNEVVPCVDETIQNYNAQNPETAFKLLTEQDIVESAIKDARTLR